MAKVIALHGMLGAPSDWDGFGYEARALESAPHFLAWAERFCAGISGRPVLLGYSMGARLAMHAALLAPDLFSGLVLVSGNPGLADEEARRARREEDERWALRFESETWSSVMRAWNAQPVFAGGESVDRPESGRAEAVCALRAWSLGRQLDLVPHLAWLDLPILWIAGERDAKFAAIARGMRFADPRSTVWLAPSAAHRVPWEARVAFSERVSEWVRSLS